MSIMQQVIVNDSLGMALGRKKTEIRKVVENLFGLAHLKDHVGIIGRYRKTGSHPRKINCEILSLKKSSSKALLHRS